MGIIKKIDDKSIKMRWATENLMMNPNSPLRCDCCHNRLGVFRMLRHSLFKEKNERYYVKCKVCGKNNIRFKGKIGLDIDTRWDEYGIQKQK